MSLGAMDSGVEAALSQRFEILREVEQGLDEIVVAHGNEIVAIVTRGRAPVTSELIGRLPRLEIVANFGVGYDSIDVVAAARRGIVVTNTPDVLNDEMADFTIGLLLATIRRLPQADRHVRSGAWGRGEAFPLSASLRGRRVGIAGLGRIGKKIARRLASFDVPVAYCGRLPQNDAPYDYFPGLPSLAEAVDVLIVVLPGGTETKHAVNAEILTALGPDGVLINVARGSVVDEAALVQALRTGKILAAGLDVFAKEPYPSDELLAMKNVVLLPHIGTATHHTRGLMRQLVIVNINSWFDGCGAITPVRETSQKGSSFASAGNSISPSG
jgi:lactate dehydrogenase-like 2-hydroxyacid dehydrogenase